MAHGHAVSCLRPVQSSCSIITNSAQTLLIAMAMMLKRSRMAALAGDSSMPGCTVCKSLLYTHTMDY